MMVDGQPNSPLLYYICTGKHNMNLNSLYVHMHALINSSINFINKRKECFFIIIIIIIIIINKNTKATQIQE